MFEKLGLRPARLNALLAALAETSGGLLFAAGFLTPAASAAIIAAITVAALGVHLHVPSAGKQPQA
jgi:putative oxidoreductase